MTYKFEREELLALLVKAYNAGNRGFLDMAESVAENLLQERKCGLGISSRGVGPGIFRNYSQHSVNVDNLVVVNSNDESS